MAEEIIINISSHESRVAVVEKSLLQEIFIERFQDRGTVGNIYHGKVVRILPGMQSAFVAIGQEKAAFMHITDLIDSHEAIMEERGPNYQFPPIVEVLHDGQELLVQVTKEPIGTKGARITGNISLASRYLVYLPDTNHVGISQRIEDEEERSRLRGLLELIQDPDKGDGFIVRTASEGVSEEEISKDADLLRARWTAIVQDGKTSKAQSLVHEDLPLAINLRLLRETCTGTECE